MTHYYNVSFNGRAGPKGLINDVRSIIEDVLSRKCNKGPFISTRPETIKLISDGLDSY